MAEGSFVSGSGQLASSSTTAPGLTTMCKEARYDGADVQKTVSHYNGHFAKAGKKEDYQSRKEKYYDITQRFYIMVTDFYEYGYGTSFHFAPVLDGKSLTECIHVYEEEIVRTLKAKSGMKILVSVAKVKGNFYAETKLIAIIIFTPNEAS